MEEKSQDTLTKSATRKTYIVDISDLAKTWNNFEKRTRYEIRKCTQIVRFSDDLIKFDYFHRLSRPDRRIDFSYILGTYKSRLPNCRLYATDTAMAMVSWNKTTGYYLLAGRDKGFKDGSPSKILWQAMQDLNKMGVDNFDLCGANKENIILFKRGFGGKLVPQDKPCLCY